MKITHQLQLECRTATLSTQSSMFSQPLTVNPNSTDDRKKLDYVWQEVLDDYKIVRVFNQDPIDGDVVKAKHKETGRAVVIKLVRNAAASKDRTLKALRQLQILRKMTQEKQNIFIMHLLDVIVPDVGRKELVHSAKQWREDLEKK